MKKILKTLLNLITSYSFGLFLLISISILSGCSRIDTASPITSSENSSTQLTPTPMADSPVGSLSSQSEKETISQKEYSIFDETGTTLENRIHSPEGYVRIPSVSVELTGFLHDFTLKESGSEVLLYNGEPKGNQSAHAAIFDLDIGSKDLQQCADSILRIYAEYYWSVGAYDKIAFHLTNGFYMEYTKWRDGNRLIVNGNDVAWRKTESYNDSYEAFRQYLTTVYIYAGTLSLSQECEPIGLKELQPGDMFLQGGSPGHCILVVDVAQSSDGNRCFLLAQGYMPAQDFHVIINPLHPEDPWYYESEITYPLETPSWTFQEGSLVRWRYFPLNEADSPLSFESGLSSAASSEEEAISAISDDVITVETPSSSQVTFLTVGDNLIHLEVVQSGLKKNGTYNFDHLYSNLKKEISSVDIAVINQETILGGSTFPYSGYPNFNSPTEIGDAVIHAGFDVVLQATNHTMDMGYRGIKNTFSYWAQHPEITVLGINKSQEASQKITVLEKNGIKLALLNYTYGLNGYSLPKDKPYLVNLLDKKKMQQDIKLAETLADITVVFPHWGSEYVYKETSMQEELTDFFYDLGVDLVIGTHPHVLEPVEWIEPEPDHRMLVYYSLGNFMSYQKEAPRMLGGLAKVTITKDSSGTYISDASITPLVTHFENGPSDFHYGIYKLSDYTPALAKVHGVSDLAHDGDFTYEGTVALAKEILGDWYQQ